MTARRHLLPALLSLVLLGQASPAFAAIWYQDLDNDGWGNPSIWIDAPSQPPGYVATPGDCNDNNPGIRPGAPEVCNGIDDDCDGAVDEGGIGQTWYRDLDNDGFGSPASTVLACSAPPGYVANSGDCNDNNPMINPSATETCNGIDDDCDGAVDDGAVDATTWYADNDADGHGDPAVAITACSPPSGYVSNGDDCDDSNPAIHPDASEVCNGIDDDCDGAVDEGGAGQTWYADNDADGHGDPVVAITACSPPSGYVSNGDDCDDSNPAIYPGAPEVCNSADDDCDGAVDEGGVCIPFQIQVISDVGNDQGRQVRILWNPQANDRLGMPLTITSYSIYRLVEAGLAPGAVEATPPGTWDHVASVPASGEALYSKVVPTLRDSTASGICWSTYFVRAHTPAPLQYFDTAPVQGYSVDNLAPAAPQALVVTYSATGNMLAWDGEAEPDLGYWRIYRGTVPGFVPSSATLVHSTASPSWTDAPSTTSWYYKVTAVDFAGNEGLAASVQGTVDAGASTISGFGLRGAAPNPSSGSSIVSFDVPAPGGKIALHVYDPTGRLVGTLGRGFYPAGTHRIRWDGQDSGGRMLPSGTYYLRFQTPAGTFARRVTLIR